MARNLAAPNWTALVTNFPPQGTFTFTGRRRDPPQPFAAGR
jgi:hypothetical protein